MPVFLLNNYIINYAECPVYSVTLFIQQGAGLFCLIVIQNSGQEGFCVFLMCVFVSPSHLSTTCLCFSRSLSQMLRRPLCLQPYLPRCLNRSLWRSPRFPSRPVHLFTPQAPAKPKSTCMTSTSSWYWEKAALARYAQQPLRLNVIFCTHNQQHL